MIELIQIPIVLFGIAAVVALAANRIFLGCLLAAIGQPFWLWSAYHEEQWGVIVVLSVYLLAYLLGIIARWPRKLPVGDDDKPALGI